MSPIPIFSELISTNLIGILDSKDEFAVVFLGKQVVIQRCPEPTQMHHARRARSIPNSNTKTKFYNVSKHNNNMSTKEVDLTQKQKFIFTQKLEKKQFKRKYPKISVQINSSTIQFVGQPSQVKKAIQYVQQELKQFAIEFLDIKLQHSALEADNEYNRLKTQIEHEIIYKVGLQKRLQELKKRGLDDVYEYFTKKINKMNKQEFMMLLISADEYDKLIEHLFALYKTNKPINRQASLKNIQSQPIIEVRAQSNPKIELNLQLNSEKLLLACLLKLFSFPKQLIVYDKNDKLFIKGAADVCTSAKEQFWKRLNLYRMLVLLQKDMKDEYKHIQDGPAEFQIFDHGTTQLACELIVSKYNIDEPLNILKEIQHEKGAVVVFTFLKQFERRVRQKIIRITKLSADNVKLISEQLSIDIPDILAQNIDKLSGLLDKLIDQKMLQLKKFSQSIIKSKQGLYSFIIEYDGKHSQTISVLKKQFSEAIKNLHYSVMKEKLSLDEISKIKGVRELGIVFEYKGEVYFAAVENYAERYSKMHKLLENEKIQVEKQIQMSSYFLLKDQIERIMRENSEVTFSELKANNYKLIMRGFRSKLDSIKALIDIEITRIQSDKDSDCLLVNLAQATFLRESKYLQALQNEFEIDIKLNEIKQEGIDIILDNFNKIRLSTLKLQQNSSKMKLILDKKQLTGFKKSQWINFKDTIIKSNMFEHYDQARYLYYLDSSHLQLSTVFQKVFSKKLSVATYTPTNLSVQNFVIKLYEFMCKNKQLPMMVVCCKDSRQIGDVKAIVNTLKSANKKTLSFLVKEEEIWCFTQDNNIIPYNEKADKKIKEHKIKNLTQVLLNEQQLQLTKKTHVYYKAQSMLWNRFRFGITAVRVLKNRYFYTLDGVEYQFSQKSTEDVNSATGNEVLVTCAQYRIDLTKNIQINIETKNQLKISLNTISKTNLFADKQIEVKQLDNTYQILFETSQLKMKKLGALKQKLKGHLQQNAKKYCQTIELHTKIISINDLEKLCQNCYVQINRSKIEIKDNAVLAIPLESFSQRSLDTLGKDFRLLQLTRENKVPEPNSWTSLESDIQIINVQKSSEQFLSVEREFKFDKIKRLIRIQNYYLWKQYYNERKDLQKLSGEPIKQLRLFHGTNKEHPKAIYMDKIQSFNLNYASETNVFGKGIYFAKEAAYSHSYSFSADKSKFMLYCLVLVGQSQQMRREQADNKIKDTKVRDTKLNLKYESIKSNYGGSDIYIVYKSRRAYPEYLIQY